MENECAKLGHEIGELIKKAEAANEYNEACVVMGRASMAINVLSNIINLTEARLYLNHHSLNKGESED